MGSVNQLCVELEDRHGIGLSVDAAGLLVGRSFLPHYSAQDTSAGVMPLTLNQRLTLTAFGLIATRLPDGRPGYSLIIFIIAEDFVPIQQALGFTLASIGGLMGIRRTVAANVLHGGRSRDLGQAF